MKVSAFKAGDIRHRITAICLVSFVVLLPLAGNTSAFASDIIPQYRPDSERLWHSALNAYDTQKPDASALLTQFITQYPADLNTNKARLLLADIQFYNHDWPVALSLYNQANIAGLTSDERSLYSYRKSLCLIKTGHYTEAGQLMKDIKGRDFTNIRNFYSAYLAYIDGDFKTAYKRFEKVTPGIPGLDAEYYLAQIDYTRGDYQKVLKLTTRQIKEGPAKDVEAEIYRINGMSAFKVGDYERGRASLLKYQELNRGSESPEALYALGVIDYNSGNYRRASRYFEPVTATAGDLGQSAWLYLGQCRLQEGNVQAATLAFEKAAAYETNPAVTQSAMYNYVTALTRGGNIPFSRSSEMLETFLSRWPDSEHAPAVEEYLAAAYLNDHNYLKAIQLVNNTRHPSVSLLTIKQRALYEQGVQEAVNGDYRQSIPYFSQASDMRKTDTSVADNALLWLADAQYSDAQFAKAAANYSNYIRLTKDSPNRTLAQYNLAYTYFQLKRYKDAASEFAKAVDARPSLDNASKYDAQLRRADCLYYIGDYNTAVALYEKGMNTANAETDYAAYRYATTVGRAKSARDKINALDNFISHYPNSKWLSAALLEKALTHEELGETSQAAECYRRRLAITPDVGVDELWRVADANDLSASSSEDQLAVLDKITAQGNLSAEESQQIDLYRANALHRLGRDTEANAIYLTLSQNPAGESGAKAAVTLANNLIKNRQYEQALALMEEFTDTGTPHQYWLARGFIAMADCYKALDRPELAREYLESLRDNYPNNQDDILSIINQRLKGLK